MHPADLLFRFRELFIEGRPESKGSVADESGISPDDPLTIQDWQVDKEKGYALLQVVIKKRKAGFIESAVQIATYLETDNFI